MMDGLKMSEIEMLHRRQIAVEGAASQSPSSAGKLRQIWKRGDDSSTGSTCSGPLMYGTVQIFSGLVIAATTV